MAVGVDDGAAEPFSGSPSSAKLNEGATIADIANAQRVRNACIITSALSLLTLLAAAVVLALGGRAIIGVFLTVTAAGMAAGYWFARRGQLTLAVPLLCGFVIVEHVGSVALAGGLGPVPYIAPIIILITAATARAAWLWRSFVVCVALLAVEGWLSPWGPAERQAIATAGLFGALVFVVSWLHVHGTERAFAIAEDRDRARAAAAAAAMQSEERYRLIADSADDLIALVGPDGVASYLSPSHERVLGVAVARAINQPLRDHLAIENTAESVEMFLRALRCGEAHGELSVRTADGRRRVLDAHMKRVETDSTMLVAIISRDVTERRDLERRLQTSQRLEALGKLAGSVAHDFNNLLTVIGGSADLALAQLSPSDPVRPELDAVQAAVGTATDLARQLLTFSRQQLVVLARVDVRAALRAQSDILKRLVGPSIELQYDLPESLPKVLVPQAHVEQLALNLVANARDAMPEGGKVIIAARLRKLADREVGDLVGGDYVELSVRDQGTGIADAVLPHLFEPFYSTKQGLGTGLGLATCHGIAVQAGGGIEVETDQGRGSTFRVFVPVAGAGIAPQVTPKAARASEHVLVVDDDLGVRDMTTRMLLAEGRQVRTASTLTEARAILNDPAIAVDVLLTDVVIGQERGTDLILASKKDRPGLRIVVMSGYTPDPGASELVAAERLEFLAKPFGRDQLLRALRGR